MVVILQGSSAPVQNLEVGPIRLGVADALNQSNQVGRSVVAGNPGGNLACCDMAGFNIG